MNGFTEILVLAGISEAVWEHLKMVFTEGKFNINRLGAILIGVLLCLATGANFLEVIGLPTKIDYIGQILTGLLISRGANFIHDFLTSVNNLQQYTRIENITRKK